MMALTDKASEHLKRIGEQASEAAKQLTPARSHHFYDPIGHAGIPVVRDDHMPRGMWQIVNPPQIRRTLTEMSQQELLELARKYGLKTTSGYRTLAEQRRIETQAWPKQHHYDHVHAPILPNELAPDLDELGELPDRNAVSVVRYLTEQAALFYPIDPCPACTANDDARET
jgi:hypothetical protein